MLANRQQACAIFGWSSREFDKYCGIGMPGRKKSGSKGDVWQIDTVEVMRWIAARAVTEAVGDGSNSGVLDFNTERTRLTKEQADKLERERLLDERRLVPADTVHRLIEQLVGGANARLGAMPAKLAPIVNPEDPAGARRHLELGIEEVRSELRRLETDEPRDADAA
jgi:phage terminase Nu1 subunit (DNA packaging protein)